MKLNNMLIMGYEIMKKYIAKMSYTDKYWPYYFEEEDVKVDSIEEAEKWCEDNSSRRQYYTVKKLKENFNV